VGARKSREPPAETQFAQEIWLYLKKGGVITQYPAGYAQNAVPSKEEEDEITVLRNTLRRLSSH